MRSWTDNITRCDFFVCAVGLIMLQDVMFFVCAVGLLMLPDVIFFEAVRIVKWHNTELSSMSCFTLPCWGRTDPALHYSIFFPPFLL